MRRARPSLRGSRLWLAAAGVGGGLLYLLTRGGLYEAGQVKATRTPLSRQDAEATLRSALQATLGRAPSSAELKMLAAQSDLETRGWQALWNWNFGNLTTSAPPFFKLSGIELKFRAYPSAADGAKAMVQLLAKKYPKAFALLGSGDTQKYASALKEVGYFGTGDAQKYAQGLASRYASA